MACLEPLATADDLDLCKTVISIRTTGVGTKNTNLEANLPQLVRVDDQTTVKDERRLGHVVVDGLPVDLPELLPLGRDHDRLALLRIQDHARRGRERQ